MRRHHRPMSILALDRLHRAETWQVGTRHDLINVAATLNIDEAATGIADRPSRHNDGPALSCSDPRRGARQWYARRFLRGNGASRLRRPRRNGSADRFQAVGELGYPDMGGFAGLVEIALKRGNLPGQAINCLAHCLLLVRRL